VCEIIKIVLQLISHTYTHAYTHTTHMHTHMHTVELFSSQIWWQHLEISKPHNVSDVMFCTPRKQP